MKFNIFERFFGSGFYSGYFPVASGTVASIAAIIIYLIPGFEQLFIIIPIIIIFLLYGLYVGTKFEAIYGKDPSECTIDEVVGTWISLIALPKSVFIIVITFIIWRILDIIKPPPARKLEQLKGGFGIMIDDIIAGLYTLIIMHAVVYLFGNF